MPVGAGLVVCPLPLLEPFFTVDLSAMPTQPLAACRAVTCPGRATHHGWCVSCWRTQEQRRRARGHHHLYGRRWDSARLAFLREHRHCHYCAQHGHVTLSTCVDHVVPHKGQASLFWDQHNWVPSCGPCNTRKAITFEGGFGRTPQLLEGVG